MKPKLLLKFAVLTACGATMASVAPGLVAAEPSASHQEAPMDLARGSVGARLQVQAPKGDAASAQALISDDASLSYSLAAGGTSMIVTLPKIEVLNRFNFISYEAAGQMNVSVSSVKLPFESADWHPVAKSQSFAAQAVNACSLGSVEARYIKIDFNTILSGRIAGLGLFGLPAVSNFAVQPASVGYSSGTVKNFSAVGGQTGNVFFDFASLGAGAHVVATSRGGNSAEAQAILDGNAETSFTFDPADAAPTVVVDLGASRSLNRVSCVYQAPAGQLDFYLADNPNAASDFQRVSLNYVGEPQAASAKVATVEVTGKKVERPALASVQTTGKPGVQQASADFGGRTGRFLIAAFHPTGGDFKDYKDRPHRDFKDTARDFKDFKDFKDANNTADTINHHEPAPLLEPTPFKLTALSAFGQQPGGGGFVQLPPPSGGGITGGVPPQPPINPPSNGGGIVTP